MNTKLLDTILDLLREKFREIFQNDLTALILYGSWARGTARGDSDIDLLALFEKADAKTRNRIDEIVADLNSGKMITVVLADHESFRSETIPLYTAVKREGRIVDGDADLTVAPLAPEVKYAEFFKKSYDVERQKVEVAEELIGRGMGSGIADLCFVAAKHAIQAALAMRGEGYSSKVKVLLPLAKKRFGREISQAFRKLFELYIQTEYGLEFLSEEEAKAAVDCAKRILSVYATPKDSHSDIKLKMMVRKSTDS